MNNNHLLAGEIVGAHGLDGTLKIKHHCDNADVFCALDTIYIEGNPKKVTRSAPHKNIVLAKIDGVSTANAATLLRGKAVYAPREAFNLPENTYFFADLIGLTVEDADTHIIYGTVSDILRTGAHDVYEIEKNGKHYYMPVIKECNIKVEIENKKIFCKPLEGLFDL
jgi:16S rRNA processing protein RimM